MRGLCLGGISPQQGGGPSITSISMAPQWLALPQLPCSSCGFQSQDSASLSSAWKRAKMRSVPKSHEALGGELAMLSQHAALGTRVSCRLSACCPPEHHLGQVQSIFSFGDLSLAFGSRIPYLALPNAESLGSAEWAAQLETGDEHHSPCPWPLFPEEPFFIVC